ncbi:TPA: DUF4870 family protein [Photobacterium damselae]
MSNGQNNAKIIYILYLVGLVIGVTGIVGVIMAYVNKGDAPQWLQDHFRFQIRTFWMGLLLLFVGGILSSVFVGFFIVIFAYVWYIVRCVKGMKSLSQGQAPANVETWLF